MKRTLFTAMACGLLMAAAAQTDSAKGEKYDTIRIGGTTIIKKKSCCQSGATCKVLRLGGKKGQGRENIEWWVVDLGFANFRDNSNYTAAAASGFIDAALGKDNLELRTGKSVNVNIWVFMQRLPVVKRVVGLKYGLGLELNNYRFENEVIAFRRNPTFIGLNETYKEAKKNKLAADYVTVPLLLNVNLTPRRTYGFGFSGGISAGYLYASRQKLKLNKDIIKTRDDFDLNRWKLSYIGELNLGPVRLYGSYALKNMWEKGLDQRPYTVGLRLAHF